MSFPLQPRPSDDPGRPRRPLCRRTDLVEAADARLPCVGAGRLRLVGRRVQTGDGRVVQGEAVTVQRDAHGHLVLRYATVQVIADGEVLRRRTAR